MQFKIGDMVRLEPQRGEAAGLRVGAVYEIVAPGDRPVAPLTASGNAIRAQPVESYVVRTAEGDLWPMAETLRPVPEAEKHRLAALLSTLAIPLDASDPGTSPDGLAAGVAFIASLLGRTDAALTEADRHPTVDKLAQRSADASFLELVHARLLDTCDGCGVDPRLPATSGAMPSGRPETEMHTYTAKLKTRAQMDREIPRDRQGWWRDTCPGQTLRNMRDATEADLARCIINEGRSRNPADYLCENIEHGWLVSREAVAVLRPNNPMNRS